VKLAERTECPGKFHRFIGLTRQQLSKRPPKFVNMKAVAQGFRRDYQRDFRIVKTFQTFQIFFNQSFKKRLGLECSFSHRVCHDSRSKLGC